MNDCSVDMTAWDTHKLPHALLPDPGPDLHIPDKKV